MGKREWVDKNHYRDTSDDGRRSWLYETDDGLFSQLVEVADHHEDGTTDAYEADNSVLGGLLRDFKGEHKGKSKDC